MTVIDPVPGNADFPRENDRSLCLRVDDGYEEECEPVDRPLPFRARFVDSPPDTLS